MMIRLNGCIFWLKHCVKSDRIRDYCGPHFHAFGLNTDQNKCEYGHFLRSEDDDFLEKYNSILDLEKLRTRCRSNVLGPVKLLRGVQFFGRTRFVLQKRRNHLIYTFSVE